MSENKDKLFDLSSIGIEEKRYESAGDLISDKDLDEMQKAVSYKVSFDIMKASYWIWILISMAMLIVSEIGEETNLPMVIFAIITEVIDNILYCIYASKVSAKGMMREKFAKTVGRKSYFWAYLALGVFYMCIMYSMNIFYRVYIGILYLSICIISLYAIRNNKVLEQMNREE